MSQKKWRDREVEVRRVGDTAVSVGCPQDLPTLMVPVVPGTTPNAPSRAALTREGSRSAASRSRRREAPPRGRLPSARPARPSNARASLGPSAGAGRWRAVAAVDRDGTTPGSDRCGRRRQPVSRRGTRPNSRCVVRHGNHAQDGTNLPPDVLQHKCGAFPPNLGRDEPAINWRSDREVPEACVGRGPATATTLCRAPGLPASARSPDPRVHAAGSTRPFLRFGFPNPFVSRSTIMVAWRWSRAAASDEASNISAVSAGVCATVLQAPHSTV